MIPPAQPVAEVVVQAAPEPAPEPEPEPEPEFIPDPVPDTVRLAYRYRQQGPLSLGATGTEIDDPSGLYPGAVRLPRWALKTNLLWDATLTPNLSLEVATGPRNTVALSAGYNPWKVDGTDDDNKKLAHRLIQAEYRWWCCESFNSHFIGAQLFGGDYNVSGYNVPLLFKKKYRYQGYGVGAGFTYGYHLVLQKRWSLEFTVGVGVAYLHYDRYDCAKCSDFEKTSNKFYFGPTKLGINLVYILK